MTSEEYIDAVRMMMENQDRYFNWFLVILGIFLVFVGVIQWRLSTKQLEQLKEKTKQETIKEVKESLGVADLKEFNSNIHKEIAEFKKMNYTFANTQLDYELTKFYTEKKEFLWHIPYLMDIYRNSILNSFNDFNYFVSRIDSLISISIAEKIVKVDIHSDHIDNILRKLNEFESTFNKKSEALESFQNQIKYYRNQEK